MKRKHGHTKGKNKKPRVDNEEQVSKTSESIDVGDSSDSDELETPVVTEPSSSTMADEAIEPAIVVVERPIQKPVTTAVYGRVKVRLKAPKALESQVTPADAGPKDTGTHSGSGHRKSVDKQDLVVDKIEDSANSLPDAGPASGEKPSGRDESIIKIKTSNVLVSVNATQNADVVAQKDDKLKHEDPRLPHQDPQYNKKELDAALEVVTKVMKMDAAEPFNVPVNPVELGIPDYFDVIDTPMDFGTVRSNLQSGTKYINSESVYMDVRYIWDNCYKYNNKGDYIVDLMKRVKKNFMKYWAAAGLYSDQPKKGNGVKGNEGGSESQEKKQKKGKGLKKHKDGCLCAICIMKRRRKDRVQKETQETRETKGQDFHTSSGISDPNLAKGLRSEERENQGGEEISSSVENSQDDDGDEVEDVTEDMKSVRHNSGKKSEENKLDNHDTSPDFEAAPHGVPTMIHRMSELNSISDSSPITKADAEKQQPVYVEAQTSTLQKRKIELIKAEKERQKAELYKSLGALENQTLGRLCKTLFPEKQNSVWVGPHSLFQRKKPEIKSDIFTAVSSLMSPSPKRACK